MLAYPSIFSRLTTGLDFTSVFELPCASLTFLTVNTVCADCIYFVQPADITLQVLFLFLSAAQFLTVNSGRRFFSRTPSVLLSSTSERPSTAKTTQHPDPSIDPLVDPSHLSPHPSFPPVPATSCPDPNIDPQVDQAYFAPHPPCLPHGFNYDISKTSLSYRLSLICF